ncbi:keratin, type II cytoskeletal 2 epidermal-like [Homarus americanus]|uniref:keratin, type II cytoskeletal 2 epidermal-like n=1 Tax=Homarus americanus TaxID=6706 RepID=UPI001C47BED6|nr:keratin, type II cytoskeletal 2 epidermal-like [Homarus americanus]
MMEFLYLVVFTAALVAADGGTKDASTVIPGEKNVGDTGSVTDDNSAITDGSSPGNSAPSTRFFPGGFNGGFGEGFNNEFGGGFNNEFGGGFNHEFGGGFDNGLNVVGNFPGGGGFGFGGPGVGVAGGVGVGVGAGFGRPIGGFGVPITCRYWCRTRLGRPYCCETPFQRQSFARVVKFGYCPPVRTICPPIRNFLPPYVCSSDGSCPGIDKCCFDSCLHHHTCKPPLGFGR